MGMAAILVMWPGPFEQTFIPPSHGGSTWNLASIGQAVSKEKKFENVNLRELGPMSMYDLDLWYSQLTASTNFDIIDYNSFWKIHCFTYKSIRDQIWPCREIYQGQSRVIMWANLVVLEHPMMYTKFQGHRPFGSREEDFPTSSPNEPSAQVS